jgi:hypothetical protein
MQALAEYLETTILVYSDNGQVMRFEREGQRDGSQGIIRLSHRNNVRTLVPVHFDLLLILYINGSRAF